MVPLCLEKAQFVVLSRAGFSLPALLVALPATPEAPPGRNKNVVLISWKEKGVSGESKDPSSKCRVQRGHAVCHQGESQRWLE